MTKAHSSQHGHNGGFQVGDEVVTLEWVKPSRLAGKTGKVSTLNHDAGEIGVEFSSHKSAVWFYPKELYRRQPDASTGAGTASTGPAVPRKGRSSTQLPPEKQ